MCGIAGIFGRPDEVVLNRMLATMTHRGPDDVFSVTGDSFSIGARRLSIIDVGNGRQPICNENEDIWVAQNGEIYNFKEQRKQLISDGHQFKTQTDTEVLIHLYEKYGDKLPIQLDGMFAIAIWDRRRNRGLLVRDRVGKKPLYYTTVCGNLYFASEIKALLQIPGFRKETDLEALYHYLSYKNVPCPMSIFKGIQQLPPASTLVYSDTGELALSRYWHTNFATSNYPEKDDEDQWESLILATIRSAVRKRLVGDVPIGFLLSGGIDSGLIVALAADMSKTPIDTFTLTYPDDKNDTGKRLDKEIARAVSTTYGTNHHEETINYPDFPTEFPKIIASFDEPFAGVTSTYFLAREISKHVKVAVSGDGADELFGSYLSHRIAAQGQATEDVDWRYNLLVFSDKEKRMLLSPDIVDWCGFRGVSIMTHLRKCYSDLTAEEDDPLNRILEMEFNHQLPDQVLTFADRLSMAHGLEIRSPYLDDRLVEMVSEMPSSLKIRINSNNTIEEMTTKYTLKKMASRYLHPNTVSRKKEGFIMPVTEWLYRDLQGYVRETLDKRELDKHGIFDVNHVNGLVNSFYKRDYDYRIGNKILTLLAFQMWYGLYMSGTTA